MANEPTLDELLTIPTQQEVLDQEVLPALRGRNLRVTDWLVNATYRTMAYVVSKLRLDVRLAIAALAAAGFEDYVFGLVDVPNGIDVTDWAPIVAKQRYGLDQIEATFTKREITLTNATATPYSVVPGDITVQFPSGLKYVLDQAGTILANAATVLVFRSELATDSTHDLVYTDPSGSALVLVTSNFPGVSATNPAPTYSDVTQSGSGVGTVTPSGSPTGTHAVAVRIDTTGLATTAAWSTSLDGGAWVARSGATATNLGGFGINVTLANNGGSPAFVLGALYYFNTPGSDITQVGRDIETPPELGGRCRALIPLFAAVKDGAGNFIPISPTASGYEFLARQASDQVKVVLVENDPLVNNKINIYVAGQGAVLPGSAIAAVQNYLDSWHMISDRPVVLSVATRAITLAGSMSFVAKKGQKAAAQAALQRALQLYFGGVDQGDVLGVNGLLEHAYIVSLMRRTVGIKRLVDDELLTINGVADDLQLPVTAGAHELAVWSQAISTAFPWAEE